MGLSLGDPNKVKACKSFIFTDGSHKVENKDQLVDFVVTLYLLVNSILKIMVGYTDVISLVTSLFWHQTYSFVFPKAFSLHCYIDTLFHFNQTNTILVSYLIRKF